MKFLRSFFFAPEGGAGAGGEPAAPRSDTPDITHDESGYGREPLVGVDDILTPDKFGQEPAVTPESVAKIGSPEVADPDATPTEQTTEDTPVVDPVAELFASYEEPADGGEAVPDLPEGVEKGTAAAAIFKQQQQQLSQLQTQNQNMQQRFQQMGYAYDQEVQQHRQQMAVLNAQVQQLMQGGQQQQQQPPPGVAPEDYDAWGRLSQRFQTDINKQYDPKLEAMEQRLAQLQNHIQQQQQQTQQQQARQKFVRDARNVVNHTVFEPAGMVPADNPELFNHMLEFTYAIAHRTNQPLASCAKEAERRIMAFAKARLQAQANRRSEVQQAMKSEPRIQPSGALPLRGNGMPSQEELKANGYSSTYEWDLKGRPALPNKPAAIPELQLGDL